MSHCNTITNRLWLAGWGGGRPNFKLPQGYILYRVQVEVKYLSEGSL